jgi:hypothetical protein
LAGGDCFVPDLATARYLAIFARVGCQAVAVPYDITKRRGSPTSWNLPGIECCFWLTEMLPRKANRFRARLHGLLIAKLRGEIEAAGRELQFRSSNKTPAADLINVIFTRLNLAQIGRLVANR